MKLQEIDITDSELLESLEQKNNLEKILTVIMHKYDTKKFSISNKKHRETESSKHFRRAIGNINRIFDYDRITIYYSITPLMNQGRQVECTENVELESGIMPRRKVYVIEYYLAKKWNS